MSRLEARLGLEIVENKRQVGNLPKYGILLSEETTEELRKQAHTVIDQMFDEFVQEKNS